ncbi:MAG: DNA primase [Alphaproteobacteria bacterium]|nr:DNA primase [Alphaproteobacteria bacterium]MCL2889635.1 DNA primase [Alphaproteobacteria bacterium]
MAGSSNHFNDELRAKLSIVDIVGKRVPLTKKGHNFWGCCPFHNEKTPSFSVNESKGFYHCFGCGEHGDIISFVMKSQNMQYIDAIKELAMAAGMKMPEFRPKSPEQAAREQSYFDIMENACRVYQNALWSSDGAAALEYVRKRGFSDEVIKKYRLGFAPNKFNTIAAKFSDQKLSNVMATGLVRQNERGAYDFFRNRLMFPIFNPNGQVIAFSGRSMDGSEPKYINTTDTELFHKRKTVFGLNFARDAIYKANRSIVVEGQIDAIQMQIHGFGETVAPLGTALTEDHLQILAKANRNIIFCFDGDGAGQKAAARGASIVMPLLRDNSDVRFVFMPTGTDPDDILRTPGGTSVMKKIIDSAIPLVDFLWNIANKNFVINTPNGRTQAEKFLKTEIEKITDPNLKNEFRVEFDQRKFNRWHKWQREKGKRESIEIPKVDTFTQKTLSEIAVAYPELIEKHAEFLAKVGINSDFSNFKLQTSNLSYNDAEKFIVSLKLKNYIQNLQNEKKDLTTKMLNATENVQQDIISKIKFIDSEIEKSLEKSSALSEI